MYSCEVTLIIEEISVPIKIDFEDEIGKSYWILL